MSGVTGQPTTFELSNLTAPASGKTRAFRLTVVTPVGGGTVTIPLNQYIQSLGSFRPQGLTIDNSGNANPIMIGETNFGWSRPINPGTLTSFNYPAVSDPIFYITGTVQQTVTLTLFDFPIFPETLFNSQIAGVAQSVSISNVPLPVSLPAPYGSNNNVYVANLFGNAVSTSVAVGTVGKTTYAVGYDLTLSENATLAAAGENLFTIQSTAPIVIAKQNLWLPAAALTTGFVSRVMEQRFDYPMLLSLGITPTVEILSAAALATGHYNLNLYLVDM